MKTNPNEPINPSEVQINTDNGDVHQNCIANGVRTASGLTKREYFTALAMQGLCANVESESIADIASSSVKIADALIKALNKENNNG